MAELAVEVRLEDQTEQSLVRVRSLASMPRAITQAVEERAAIDDLAFVQRVRHALETARTELVRPLNDRVKGINERFRVLAEPVALAEGRIKDALLAWRQAETRRLADEREAAVRAAEAAAAAEAARQAQVDAELRAAAEAAGFGDEAEASAPPPETFQVEAAPVLSMPPPAPTVRTDLGRATVRRVWAWEIVDASAVPRAYCEPSEPLLRRAIQAGVRDIEGVTIFEREVIAGGRP